MTVREYIGARYVPLFMGEWDNTVSYEPLSVVLYQGNSYTSRQYVAIGTDITDENFWAETGNFNAQVEAYRNEVIELSNDFELMTKFNVVTYMSAIYNDFENFIIENPNCTIVVDPGTYLFSNVITIPKTITLIPNGGIISTENYVNFIVNGNIELVRKQLFDVNSSVIIRNNNIGYPEWFGGKIADISFDNAPMINKCIELFPITELGVGRYSVYSPIYIETNNKTLKGIYRQQQQPDNGSTIDYRGTDYNVVLKIGKDTFTSTAEMVRGTTIENINVTDYRSNTVSGVTFLRSFADTAISIKYTLGTRLVNVEVTGGLLNSFYQEGCIRTYYLNCRAYRLIYYTEVDQADIERAYAAYRINNNSNVGVAGGNGITFIDNCITSIEGASFGRENGNDKTYGLVSSGTYGPCDLVVNNFMSTHAGHAVYITGSTIENRNLGNRDILLSNLVLDTAKIAMTIADMHMNANVEISNSYFDVPYGSYACHIHDIIGNVSLANCQSIHGDMGFRITNAKNISMVNCSSFNPKIFGVYISDSEMIGIKNTTVYNDINCVPNTANYRALSIANATKNCDIEIYVFGDVQFSENVFVASTASRIAINLTGLTVDSASSGHLALFGSTHVDESNVKVGTTMSYGIGL